MGIGVLSQEYKNLSVGIPSEFVRKSTNFALNNELSRITNSAVSTFGQSALSSEVPVETASAATSSMFARFGIEAILAGDYNGQILLGAALISTVAYGIFSLMKKDSSSCSGSCEIEHEACHVHHLELLEESGEVVVKDLPEQPQVKEFPKEMSRFEKVKAALYAPFQVLWNLGSAIFSLLSSLFVRKAI